MTFHEQFDTLRSDGVYAEGLLASDVASLSRRLARTEQVAMVAEFLSSDPDRIRQLATYVDKLVQDLHDPKFRHPNDIAVCAALVVLRSSPLSQVQHLITRLSKEPRPSLVWVRRVAEYVRDLFVPSQLAGFSVPSRPQDPGLYLIGAEGWSNPEGTTTMYEFDDARASELCLA